MSITIHVDGLAEIQRKLLELPDRVNRRVTRHAVSDAAAIIRDEAKALAPVYTGEVAHDQPPPGTLKKAIYMKYINEQSGPTRTVFYVGVRHGKSRQHVGKKGRNLDAFYFKFVEFGHYTRPAGGGHIPKGSGREAFLASGAVHQFVLAQPFMRPAFDTKKEAALEAMKEGFISGIAEEVASL